MARLYANENFPAEAAKHLRALDHDMLTTRDVGKSNQGIEDDSVLRFAIESNRCVISINRRDFIRLHRARPDHAGIIVCTEHRDYRELARRIDEVIREAPDLANQLLRVVRGNPP